MKTEVSIPKRPAFKNDYVCVLGDHILMFCDAKTYYLYVIQSNMQIGYNISIISIISNHILSQGCDINLIDEWIIAK